jgi:hypothetical protein
MGGLVTIYQHNNSIFSQDHFPLHKRHLLFPLLLLYLNFESPSDLTPKYIIIMLKSRTNIHKPYNKIDFIGTYSGTVHALSRA